MSLPALHRSRPAAIPPVLKAVANPRELSVTGCLTFPVKDLAGDIVRPEGLDFTTHRKSPLVDLEHGRDRDVGSTPVGTCRKSADEGGGYGVFWSTLDVDGTPHRLPFATTHFDPSDRLQSQVFALYDAGALTGYSLEFKPLVAKAIGWSELDKRPAYDFTRVDVVRYTCCAVPVCPGALVAEGGVIKKSTLTTQVPPPLAKILRDGRVGREPLHEVIVKAFAHHTPSRTVATVGKAMNDENPETVYDDAPAADATPDVPNDDAGTATPTAQTAYDIAQMLTDACEHAKEQLAKSEHVAGKKKLAKLCDQIESLVEKFTATGDMVADDVAGDSAGDMDADDDEPEVEDGATEPDDEDDGVMKAFRNPKRRVYRKAVKRFSLVEIEKGKDRQPEPAEAPEILALRAEYMAELKKSKRVLARNR